MNFVFLEFQQLFLMSGASIVMGFACYKRKDMYFWFMAYISLTIGVIFRTFIFLIDFFNIIANLGYVIAMVFTFLGIFIEYYRAFFKTDKNFVGKVSIPTLITIFITIGLGLITLVIAFINIIMITRLYLRKRTATYAFFSLSVFFAFLTLLFNILYEIGIEWSYEFSEGIDNILYSFLLVTGIIALLENRIKESELRYKGAYKTSEFYKDLIAHDTANILQNMSTTLDIASVYLQKIQNYKEILPIKKNLEDQISRGKTLIYNVRTISDFETGTYSNRNIDILNVIEKVLDYFPEEYKDKKINTKLNAPEDSYFVKANDFILNVFENILNNAIKHNENEVIEILINLEKTMKNEKQHIKIQFIDNGPGIRDKLKEHIFSKEYASTNILKRTSLGLYLVKKIIESFKGEIKLKNRVNKDFKKGTNFIILLPAVE
ncbi:MAG: putative Signal transduction histidine kinase [Promethearchaeota archaeon]|nr:MAG: putative Signal transduction histidine kinase [Candidatus Lokiarchaeota archaeon]